MAQTNYTPISLYYSTTASAVPTAANLVQGELAINTADGKLYYEDSSGVVQTLASKAGALGDVVGPASATDNALARFDLTTGKLIQNSVGILSDAGVLTGLTGLTSSGSITFSSLTSGRVTYAGASGLLSDSANLVWDNTNARLGIGTSSPYGLLNIKGSNGQLVLANGNTAGGMKLTATDVNYTANGYLAFEGYSNEYARFDSSGRFGIGTSIPAYKLEVVNTTSTPAAATFRTSGFADDNVSTIFLQDDTANALGVGGRIAFRGLNDVGSYTSFATIQGAKENATTGNNAGAMIFKTNPNAGTLTERMRISSGGLVSITGAGTEVLALNKSGGASAYLQPVSNTDASLQIKDSSGTVTLTVGTSSTTVALQGGTVSSGTGITFPATQSASSNANTLDDYEEGIWTPVFTATTAPTGVTYGTQVARYTKIGKSVTVWGVLALTSKGTGGAGEVRITGLPFTSENVSGLFPRGAGDVSDATWTASRTQITFATVPNDTYLALIESGSGQSVTNPTWGNQNNNSSYSFTVTYPTST